VVEHTILQKIKILFLDGEEKKQSPPTHPFKPYVGDGQYSGPGGGHDPQPVVTAIRKRPPGKVGGSWDVATLEPSMIGTQKISKPLYGAPFESRTLKNRSREKKHTTGDGTFEKGLVEQVTQASGVYRQNMFKKETQDFIKKCLNLDIDMISEYLNEKLEISSPYQSQQKAIAIINAIFAKKITDFAPAEDFFRDNPQNLLELKKSGKTKQLQDKAGQIIQSLGLTVTDKLNEPEKPVVKDMEPVKKDGGNSVEVDFLNLGSGEINSAPNDGGFDFMESEPEPTPNVPPMEQTENLFGNLQIKETETTGVTDGIIPQQPEPEEPNDPMLKFFVDQEVKEPKKVAKPTSRDLLGDLMASTVSSTTQNQGAFFTNQPQQNLQPQQSNLQPLFGQQMQQMQPMPQQFGQQQLTRQLPYGQQQSLYGLYGQQQPIQQQQPLYGQSQPQYGLPQQFFGQQQPNFGKPLYQSKPPSEFGFTDPLQMNKPPQVTTNPVPRKADPFAGVVDFSKN